MPIRDKEIVKILLVDDEQSMRQVVQNMFRSNGYKNVSAFGDGRTARRMIEETKYDLIVSDWAMPYVTGIELLNLIKNNLQTYYVPVVLITSESSYHKVMYAIEEGSDGLLIKPFSENDLCNQVNRVVNSIINPSDVDKLYNEVRRLKIFGDYYEALKLAGAFLDEHKHPRLALLACECLCALRKHTEALQLLEESEECDRTSVHYELFGKIYNSLGKSEEAFAYLEESISRNPLNFSRKVDLIRIHLSAGRMKEAKESVDHIMNSDPTDMTLAALAQIHLDLGDVNNAGHCLNKIEVPIKEIVRTLNNYAIALRQNKRYDECIQVYKKCIRMNQKSDVLYYNLGVLYKTLDNKNESDNCLHKALELNPNNKKAFDLLGEASKYVCYLDESFN